MADVRLSRGLLPRADAIGAASFFLPGGMALHLKLVVASAEGAERGIGGIRHGQLLHKLTCFLFVHLTYDATKRVFA